MSSGVVLEEFVTPSADEWRKEKTADDVQYLKNGIPQPEEAYHGALSNADPGAELADPYRVTDFSMEEIDAFAEQPDALSDDELQALQDVRAAYTAQYAYENVPFYEELFDAEGFDPYDVTSVEDLEALPTIDGETLRNNQPPATDDHRLANPDAPLRRPFHTSGSSGLPKHILKSYDDVDAFYAGNGSRGYRNIGITADNTLLNYYPFVGLNPSSVFAEKSMEAVGGATVPISNTQYDVDLEAQVIEAHEPDTMVALPSHAEAKARMFDEAGYDPADWGIDIITMGGEPVSEERKDVIADMWDAEVYEHYAATEVGALAWECTGQEQFHVLDDRLYVEAVDSDSDEPLPRGEEGELAVSTLLHPGEESAMPLLRYKLGDVITLHDDDRSCGCTVNGGTTLTDPHRVGNEFIFGGVNLDTVYFEENVYAHPELKDATAEYQVRLDYDESIGERAELLVGTTAEEYVGQEARDVSPDDEVTTVADELGQMLLDGDPFLVDTTHTMDAAQLDVRIVSPDEIDVGQGKPERLIDDR